MISGFMAGAAMLSGLFGLTASPPPPPSTYDPHPGPFIVFTDGQGGVGAEGRSAVKAAYEAWHGDRWSAFLLCFQPSQAQAAQGSAAAGLSVQRASLAHVSQALREAGDVRIVIGTPDMCRKLRISGQERQYVQIDGVLPQ